MYKVTIYTYTYGLLNVDVRKVDTVSGTPFFSLALACTLEIAHASIDSSLLLVGRSQTNDSLMRNEKRIAWPFYQNVS